MRLLLDECVPRRLKRNFAEHEVSSVEDAGFKGLKNGQLLQAASEADFDVMVTVDQKLVRQHRIPEFNISIIVLVALSNRYSNLAPLVPAIIDALRSIERGEVVQVSEPS